MEILLPHSRQTQQNNYKRNNNNNNNNNNNDNNNNTRKTKIRVTLLIMRQPKEKKCGGYGLLLNRQVIYRADFLLARTNDWWKSIQYLF